MCSSHSLSILSIWYWANVLRLLGVLQKLDHSNSNDIAHYLVAFRCEMQSIIPELFAQILVDSSVSDRVVEIKGITIEWYSQPVRA